MSTTIKMMALIGFILFSFPGFSNGLVHEKIATPCSFPAPANLAASETGIDYVRLTWIPSNPPPPQYNVRAVKVSTGMTMRDFNFNGNVNTITVDLLEEGTNYLFILTPVCSDGTRLDESASHIEKYTLILEILVQPQFQPNFGVSDCAMEVVGSACSLLPAGYMATFRVEQEAYPYEVKTFGMSINSNTGRKELHLKEANSSNGSIFKFYCGDMNEADCNVSSAVPHVSIKVNNTTIIHFTIKEENGQTYLLLKEFLNGGENYKIVRVPAGNKEFEDPKGAGTADVRWLTATPNPFTDLLEIQIPFANEENELTLALYDLQGRMMMTQNIANGGSYQTIETGTLPTGVYFLRVECAGKAETIKVVKTQ